MEPSGRDTRLTKWAGGPSAPVLWGYPIWRNHTPPRPAVPELSRSRSQRWTSQSLQKITSAEVEWPLFAPGLLDLRQAFVWSHSCLDSDAFPSLGTSARATSTKRVALQQALPRRA